MVGYCYVCKIGPGATGAGKRNDISVHRLPKDKKTRASWVSFIGHETGLNSGICSKHFKQSDFIYKMYGGRVRRFLKPGSCPLPRPQNTRKNVKLVENTNNCTPSRAKNDTNLETDVTINRELQKCIIIDETVMNTEDSVDIQLKRETDDRLAITEDDTSTADEAMINIDSIDMQFKRETDDPLAIIQHNTNLETNVLLKNEIQESINIDETVINTNSIDSQLKRKTDDFLATRKRSYNSRYVDDLCREDFTSDESWCLFKDYSKETKIKMRSLKKEFIHLNKRINSLQEKRNIQQLKKLWTNLKQAQREALTKERQVRFATGGGPEVPQMEINSDMAAIAPNLMATAPTLFTSNMNKDEVQHKKYDVLLDMTGHNEGKSSEEIMELVEDEQTIETINTDFLYEEEKTEAANTKLLYEGCESSLKKVASDTVTIKGKTKDIKRKLCIETEEDLKIQRLKNIMEQEEELAKFKLEYEKRMAAIKEAHLQDINQLEMRTILAKVKLAELLLKKEESEEK